MNPTWAESQIIYARRLGLLHTFKPGTLRVFDALLYLQPGHETTLNSIAAAARISRSAARRAVQELQQLRIVDRFSEPGDNAGSIYTVQDLGQRAAALDSLKRLTPAQH